MRTRTGRVATVKAYEHMGYDYTQELIKNPSKMDFFLFAKKENKEKPYCKMGQHKRHVHLIY